MDKKVKTTLIVALALFSAGVMIFLCVLMSVNFDYSKLSTSFRFGTNSEVRVKAEHIEKDIEAKGQNIKLQLSSATVTVTQSTDDMIHVSYDNNENSYFELKDSASQLTLTQKENAGFFFGFYYQQDTRCEVTLSIPAEHDGTLTINGASGSISISDVKIMGDFKIYSVSGEITIGNCKAKTLEAGNVSGNIKLTSVETDSIRANTVSGNLNVLEISKSIPVELASTSGEVYAENVNTSTLGVETVSGDITLKNVVGQKASFSATSGEVELVSADFLEIFFSSTSGGISGTVSGASDDYTVYTSTLSGSNSLSSHKGRGERTLDLSSTSGDFEISFEK